MSNAMVRSLFNTALIDYAKTKSIRVATDNAPFTPKTNETYLAAHLVPVDTPVNTLGGDSTSYIGLYRIKVVTAAGISTAVSDDIIQDLKTVFKVDKMFTRVFVPPSVEPPFTVQVVSAIHGPEGKAQEGNWVVPCYFEYRAETN